MTREDAIKKVRWGLLGLIIDKDVWDALETLIPELAESEDERIRKGLIEALKTSKTVGELKFILPEPTREEGIAYLEKQKEQKPVDFPTTDEEVNEFLETHSKVEVPEKYKTPDFVFSKQEYESHPIISKDTTSVKPAEWSEEDEEMIKMILGDLEWGRRNTTVNKDIRLYDEKIAWLNSLRPVSKESLQSHWKPSEEQMRALNAVIKHLFVETPERHRLEELYEQLKNLM